jgi:SAM-dependent methyltransferase
VCRTLCAEVVTVTHAGDEQRRDTAAAGSDPDPTHAHAHAPGRRDPGRPGPDAASWDEWYRSSDAVWSGRPNPQLVAEAADLPPGTALDVGCGEGADAVWLAQRGWTVTAVDLSTVALERAEARARAVGRDVAGRITWLAADVTTWTPPPSAHDLVSAQFMQLPQEQRDALHRRLAEGVRPGGTLLVVGHDFPDLQSSGQQLPTPELFFTAAEVAGTLDPAGWSVLVAESRPRPAAGPDGRAVPLHDAVLRAQRS